MRGFSLWFIQEGKMEDHEDVNLTELTTYQLKFIDEYMKCGNKRQAMLNAGYKGKGKRSTVTSSAAKLYNVPKVKAEIERRRRALAEENMIDSKQIVNRLSKMFNGELSSQFVTKSGQVVDVPITFKNQIEAAKVLVNILGIAEQNNKPKEEKPVTQKLAEDLEEMSKMFLEQSKKTAVEVKGIPEPEKKDKE
jgi:phage terminase small subunit